MANDALTLGGAVPEGVEATAKDGDITLTGVRAYHHRAGSGEVVVLPRADGAREPKLHEAWVEEVGETHIPVRPTISRRAFFRWPVVTNPPPGIVLRAQPLG
jgi:hypothetical protein